MKYFIVVVRDRAADCFGQPQFVNHLGTAIRGFCDEINRADENNVLYKHPMDFDLYHIGSYDDQTSEFEPMKPSQICVGKDVTRRDEQ